MFKLQFSTGGAAFDDEDDNGRGEVARIINTIAAQVAQGATSGTVLDINGNAIGRWSDGAVKSATEAA